MQVGEAELLGIVNDDRIGIRHVDTALDDAGRNQHVVFVIDEVEDDLFQLLRFHLPVADGYTGIRHFASDQRFHLVDVLDAVIDEEHLPVAAHLEVDRFADDVRIEAFHLSLYRIAVRRRRRDARQVACSHE